MKRLERALQRLKNDHAHCKHCVFGPGGEMDMSYSYYPVFDTREFQMVIDAYRKEGERDIFTEPETDHYNGKCECKNK